MEESNKKEGKTLEKNLVGIGKKGKCALLREQRPGSGRIFKKRGGFGYGN